MKLNAKPSIYVAGIASVGRNNRTIVAITGMVNMSSKDHLERIHSLACVVCVHMGLSPSWPVSAHHLESVRDADSDYAAIPLCAHHHQGANGIHGLSRRGFELRYKLTDIALLKLTIKSLEKEGRLR